MSDFLQFLDRIPTLPNRKKLTFENDGSVKYATMEYADEPIEEGTFLNKANFNKLNAVLGYNIPTYEHKHIHKETPISKDKLLIEKINTTFAHQNSVANIYGALDKVGNTMIPTLNINGIYNSSQKNIYIESGNSTSTYPVRLSSVIDNSWDYTNTGLQNIMKRETYDSNNYIYLSLWRNSKLYFDYNFIVPVNITINTRMYFDETLGTYAYIYVSQDGVIYNYETTITHNTDYSYTINNVKYVRIIFNNEMATNVNRNIRLYYLFFTNLNGTLIEDYYQNEFNVNTNDTFVNNQRILIETPNIIDLEDVEKNTIDDILCDTLLRPSTKYELIYDETNNRFNLGKLIDNTLLDITLTESVTQIQIDRLFDKFKTNVLYMCIVNGGANNNNGIYMGINEVYGINLPRITSTTTPYNYVSFFSFSKKESNIVSWDSIYYNGSDYVSAHNNLSNPQDIIAIYGSSFIAGTRIIIKEVA